MITMFITNGMYLSFIFFMSYPHCPMHISSVGLFPVCSGGSLVFILQFLIYGNLVLNRDVLQVRLRYRWPLGRCQTDTAI